MDTTLTAGASAADITPTQSLHLFGYPHVERFSTGVNDPLFASALYVHDGQHASLFVSCDIIFVPKTLVAHAREIIEESTGVPASNILIAATHTHSGPGTIRYLSNEDDSTVPEPSADYLKQLGAGIVAAAQEAVSTARPAEIGMVLANGSGVGANRRVPQGPADPDVPVLIARDLSNGEAIGLMLICAMHPTVLHEDSTLISGDFPGQTRQYLQREVLHLNCPIVYFMGASGNQSPRHVVEANTFAEAKRLGNLLGKSVANAISEIEYSNSISVGTSLEHVAFPVRSFPSVGDVAAGLNTAEKRLAELVSQGAPGPEVRTAECDLFGAQETATLTHAAQSGRLEEYAAACLPAEILLMRVGSWSFVGWPGEIFVEFAIELRERFPNAYIITLANGELQGYLVTEEAVTEGGYEASNAIFQSPESGQILLNATLDLLGRVSP